MLSEIVRVKHTQGLTDQLPGAAMQPQGKSFPFVTLLITLS
jgi:hypothetical protein